MNFSSSSSTDKSAVESLDEAVNRVMSEAEEWRRILSQQAEKTLTVYVDMKSPHAYIAIRPSIEVARDFRVKVDFRPYTLSYIGLGVSTTNVETDTERRPPSAAADRKARMYYAAARQYAGLQQIPLRSPYRLLDAALAHRVFAFAKQQGLEALFMMSVCLRGWGSGWREYEIESLESLKASLQSVGGDVRGLDDFVASGGEGERIIAQYAADAEANGFVGTPHYVFHDAQSSRDLGLFGREHLALIRHKFAAEGLARRDDVNPEFSHAWRP